LNQDLIDHALTLINGVHNDDPKMHNNQMIWTTKSRSDGPSSNFQKLSP